MNNSTKVSVIKRVPIPDLTPLPMSAPVKFFAPTVDIAIDRGVARLKATIQRDPSCNSWVVFGWIDGGLNSSFVSNPIGAFRLDGNLVFYSPVEPDSKDLIEHFSVEFDLDWDGVASLCKRTLVQGYEDPQSRSTTGTLTVAKVVNINPNN